MEQPSLQQYHRIFLMHLTSLGDDIHRGAQNMESELRSGDSAAFWYSVTAVIHSIAAVGQVLWPTQDRGPSRRRAKELRGLLEISIDSLREVSTVRNSLAHLDERIDTWEKTSLRHNFLDRIVGPQGAFVGFDDSDYCRIYDPTTAVLRIFGDEMNVQTAVAESIAIGRRARSLDR